MADGFMRGNVRIPNVSEWQGITRRLCDLARRAINDTLTASEKAEYSYLKAVKDAYCLVHPIYSNSVTNDSIDSDVEVGSVEGEPSSQCFDRLTMYQLEQKVKKAFTDSDGDWLTPTEIIAKFGADIRVKFETDIFDFSSGQLGPKEIMGYRSLNNNMTILGCLAGGDNQVPVYFCVYFDGKKLRAYVPTKGNIWNVVTNEAYTIEEVGDMCLVYNVTAIVQEITGKFRLSY